jgi:hypothetical protein
LQFHDNASTATPLLLPVLPVVQASAPSYTHLVLERLLALTSWQLDACLPNMAICPGHWQCSVSLPAAQHWQATNETHLLARFGAKFDPNLKLQNKKGCRTRVSSKLDQSQFIGHQD